MKENLQEYLLENLFDGIYYVDTNKIITYWNKSAENITGYTREEVIGRTCSDGILRHIDINGRELCKIGCPLSESIRNGKSQDAEVFLHHKKGWRVPINVRVSPVRDEHGEIIGAVEIFNDKSERADHIRHLEKIRKETLIDPVSKVGNKKYAQFHLNSRFVDMKLHNVFFGILFINIEDYYKIQKNDGNSIADNVLEMVAKTAKNSLKSMDVVARWDNAKFIVIMPNIQQEKILTEAAEKIRMFVQHSWLHVRDKIVQTRISICGVLARKNDSHESLIKRAEANAI